MDALARKENRNIMILCSVYYFIKTLNKFRLKYFKRRV